MKPNLLQMSKPFAQIQGKVSKLSEIYYPQALDTQVMINMPSFMLVSDVVALPF
jgi:hypothetical protein